MNLGIITAAGKGTRLRANINKQFIKLCGKPILAHTINVFQKSELIDEIFILVPAEYIEYTQKNIINKFGFNKVTRLIIGGETRQETVSNALKFIPDKCEMVSVHDGVRPLIYSADVDLLFRKLVEFNTEDTEVRGVILAASAYETIKQINDSDGCIRTIPRETVYHAQTPQTFFKDALIEAYKHAETDNTMATDDAMLVEKIGYKVKIIKGNHENIKITTPIDLFLAELIISKNGIH
ncbi:MAG TPA: 2-C-methyl-D-erythritol 4-phosphate cytidylyltransferase [Actinobacteria bacterium]|nr:2-C-methyl-D-erythritol 4-phosphate cytidylyltransferase [Actinomycetota bacterium]